MRNIEQDVLSACMLSTDNMLTALESGVQPGWFSDKAHGDIFATLKTESSKRTWNHNTSTPVLMSAGVFEKHPEALGICEHTPDWALNVEDLCGAIDALRAAHASSRLAGFAHSVISRLNRGDDPFDAADALKVDLEGVLDTNPDTEFCLRDEANEAYLTDEAIARGTLTSLKFPWANLQSRTFGIPTKAVTPLAGRDGKGKSRLATFLTHYWLSEGVPGLYFAFEDTTHRFLSNLAATHGRYDTFRIRSGDVSTDFLKKHAGCLDEVSRFPLIVHDRPTSVERVVSLIASAKRKLNVQWVVIDGQKDLIYPSAESQTQRENAAMAMLVRAAKEYDVSIIPIMHLTKVEDGEWISKQSIKGSGTQTQSARMVLVLQDSGWPADLEIKYNLSPGDLILECQKASYGQKGLVALQPELRRGRFVELPSIIDVKGGSQRPEPALFI